MAKQTEELHALRQDLTEARDQLQTLTARINELDARDAVRNTLLDYTLCHDLGLSEALAALFTEDATVEITGFGKRLDTSIT